MDYSTNNPMDSRTDKPTANPASDPPPHRHPLRNNCRNADKRPHFKSAMNAVAGGFMICVVLLSLLAPAAAKGCLNIWMDGKETAKCDGQGLISVPSGLSSSIHVIRLENNNFQILPSKVFQERGLINLQKIFLSNCTLGMIAQDAFHQLNHLVELDLGQNLLTSVPSESFRNLLNVRRLLLRQNPIKTLRESNFVSLNKLEHLDLSYCQIDQIEPGSFKGVPHLKSLKLNNNRLTTLTPNVFVDIPPLYTIALEHNPWNCDCELRPLHQWISVNNMLLEPPQCKTPAKYENKDWSRMLIDELACMPAVLPTETENSGQIGGNATFRCRIRSSPRPEIDWRVEEPTNLVIPSNSQSSSPNANGQLIPQPSPPYTLNTLSTNPYLNSPINTEERFIISEPMIESDEVVVSTFTLINLQPDDAQRKFICNAKNKAGLGQETFTINVYSASTVLKGGSISGTILIILLILIFLLLIGVFVFTRHRKRSKPGANSNNNAVSENKLDVLKNVKNSLVGNHHIKKSATLTGANHTGDQNNKLHVKNDQDLPNSQKLKITENGNGGLYVNGYAGSQPTLLNGGPDLMNSNAAKFSTANLQYNPAALSPYAGNLNSSGLTLLNNEMPMSGDMINGSSAMLNYGDPRMINVGPNDFTPNNQNLASSQYGTSFVQPVNHLMPYQTTGGSGYLEANPGGYLGSNDQLLNGYNNYENMYSPFNQQYVIQQSQQQQNAYGTYVGATTTGPTELQMQTTNQYAGDDTAAASVYYQNTLGKRNSPMISNNLSQSTLAQAGNALLANQDIYATLQNPQLAQHHVNILGQGSYNIAAQPTVVRYSPDDEGYSEETANSANFTLEGTEV